MREEQREINSNELQQPVKVVHIIGKLIPGGVEIRTLELIEQSRARNVEHFVCVSSGEEGTLDEQYAARGATLEYIKIKNFKFPWKLFAFLRGNKVDVVHSNLMYMSGLVLFVARLAGVPVRIAHFQSDGSPSRHQTTLERVKKILMKLLIHHSATRIVGLTPENLKIAWSPKYFSDPRCSVVPNGVSILQKPFDETGPLREYESATVVIHVGRGDLPTKNRAKAISAFSYYYHHYNQKSVLVFVGRDGATDSQASLNREELLRLSEKNAISENVLFLGERKDVRTLLHSADIFLFTSTLEGLPGVVLEALASGLPIVSSDLPGVKYLKRTFPSIEILEPSQSDEDWGSAINRCEQKLAFDDRVEAVDNFARSPFELSKAVDRYLTLWTK